MLVKESSFGKVVSVKRLIGLREIDTGSPGHKIHDLSRGL